MCGNMVWISGSSQSNLQVHQDGRNAPGKSGAGCFRRHTIAAGAKLPPTVSRIHAQHLQQNHQGLLSAFVTPAPTFSNRTLNKCLAVWRLSQDIPFKRIKDPMLRSSIHWLRPHTRVFGSKWVADEAKSLYLFLCGLVIDQEIKLSGFQY